MLRSTESTFSIYFMLLLLTTNIKSITSSKCNRSPEGYMAPRTPADGRFYISILENVDKYTPNKTYTIKLEGIAASTIPPIKHKFSGFMLVVDTKSNESVMSDYSTSSFGIFTLSHGDTFTKISCVNMVTHTTTTPTSEIQVLWTAPQPGSGCVAFKATVIEHRDVWYMDDGPLTKEFCEEEQNEIEETIEPNCAFTDWSDWSKCLPRCGAGTQIQTRRYVQKRAKKRCEGGTEHPLLQRTKPCYTSCSGEPGDTLNTDDRDEGQQTEETEESCEMSEWSDFGQCSVTCGGGVKTRTRMVISGKCDEFDLLQTQKCNKRKCEIPDYCFEDPQSGSCSNATNLWFFNRNYTRCDIFTWSCNDHGNKFTLAEECMETCTGRTIQFQQNRRKNKQGRNRNRNDE